MHTSAARAMEATDKPFKTIEVIDNDTKQVCKIACMSCIRGHRTTSCGIPVCRTKLFWTVKRPGRPSNSCTCRFNSAGVCKCVTAIPKCPHKSKKGEKRSGECRCDEQGRFCCLLEPRDWKLLMHLQKPTVQFSPNREALEAWQIAQSPQPPPSIVDTPMTIAFYNHSQQTNGSCCGTPADSTPRMSRSIATSPIDSSISSTYANGVIIPRFGFMGVGAPMGPGHTPPADVMAWDGLAPVAQPESHDIPSPYTPAATTSSCCGGNTDIYETHNDPEPSSCCGSSSQTYDPPPLGYDIGSMDYYRPSYGETYSDYDDISSPPQSQPAFDLDRWNQSYQMYQMPNAICQHCGLNGCTCRSCPPLMQNYGTTSWAQSCGRRHARIAPTPPRQQPLLQPAPSTQPSIGLGQPHLVHIAPAALSQPLSPAATQPQSAPLHASQEAHTSGMIATQAMQSPMHSQYHDPMLTPLLTNHLDYHDYLMTDTDPPNHSVDQHMYEG